MTVKKVTFNLPYVFVIDVVEHLLEQVPIFDEAIFKEAGEFHAFTRHVQRPDVDQQTFLEELFLALTALDHLVYPAHRCRNVGLRRVLTGVTGSK